MAMQVKVWLQIFPFYNILSGGVSDHFFVSSWLVCNHTQEIKLLKLIKS